MWRALAIVFFCTGLGCSAEGKQSRTTGNQLFCVNEEDLLMYMVVGTAKEFKNREMPGCMRLKRGQPYTVLDGEGRAVQKIRVRVPGRGTIDGYMRDVGE
jgi:hypothetical protein